MKNRFLSILKPVSLVIFCFTCTACREEKMLVNPKLAGKKFIIWIFPVCPEGKEFLLFRTIKFLKEKQNS